MRTTAARAREKSPRPVLTPRWICGALFFGLGCGPALAQHVATPPEVRPAIDPDTIGIVGPVSPPTTIVASPPIDSSPERLDIFYATGIVPDFGNAPDIGIGFSAAHGLLDWITWILSFLFPGLR